MQRTASGRAMAHLIYKQARPNYHSVSQTTIDELLNE
jgi:hypothetical protein